MTRKLHKSDHFYKLMSIFKVLLIPDLHVYVDQHTVHLCFVYIILVFIPSAVINALEAPDYPVN